MVRQLLARLAAWDYRGAPESLGKRDLRIDLLRGFCVFVMIVDHVGGETSWLYVLTGANNFIVSAAEGFVFLSGLSMGMVYEITIRRKGIRAMFGKLFGRAWILYLATVLLTIAFASVSSVLDTPWAAIATPAASTTDFALGVVTLHRSYSLTDILLLYTLLVLFAGPALWLISRGHTGIVLTISAVAWTIEQVWPDRVVRAWLVTDGGFPFSAWQLVFVLGLTIGYHRKRIALYLQPRYLVTFGIAFTMVLILVHTLTIDLIAYRFGGGPLNVHDVLFDKNDARIGRIVALFAVASFAYAFCTLAWRPLERRLGWLLLPMGKQALYAYAVQLFVVAFVSSELMAPVRLDRENAFFQASAVVVVWLACLARPMLIERLHRLKEQVRARFGLVAAATVVIVTLACGPVGPADVRAIPSPTNLPTTTATPAVPTATPSKSRVEMRTFNSASLRRTMPYTVWLPPSYDSAPTQRFPTLYLLHGGSGLNGEWVDYGVLTAADRLMTSGAIPPMIIVLPQGDQEYWVDHVVDRTIGANGEKWGTYTARDVVAEIDLRYRTIAKAEGRAVGGLSMGGHAALQLPLNVPGVWSVAGAHSPSLRPFGDAATYLGSGAEFAARDPESLMRAKTDLAKTLTIWIDQGSVDPWKAEALRLHNTMLSLGIPHSWTIFPGDHSLNYWSAHVEDYLHFYGSALCRTPDICPAPLGP